jgi:hypothetical protein
MSCLDVGNILMVVVAEVFTPQTFDNNMFKFSVDVFNGSVESLFLVGGYNNNFECH